jgi:hypothetical protein
MCNMVIFFENFGVHFDTFKTGTFTPKFDFLNLFPIFSSKKQILGVYVPVLNVSKWTPKFSKKITMLHIVSRTGGPEKNEK